MNGTTQKPFLDCSEKGGRGERGNMQLRARSGGLLTNQRMSSPKKRRRVKKKEIHFFHT
jgi:hypothetical protein